jgi:hypothetical protein
MVDIVSIWTAVLLVIGMKYLTTKRVGLAARIVGVVVVYVFFSSLALIGRLLSGA